MTSNFDTVAFLGDSLTDVGNLYEETIQATEQRVYQQGGWLLGWGWTRAEAKRQVDARFEGRLGDENAYSNEFTLEAYAGEIGGFGTDNYAVGGAHAVGSGIMFSNETRFDRNLGGQTERYVDDLNGGSAANDAAFLYIGMQDFNDLASNSTSFTPNEFRAAGRETSAQVIDALRASTTDILEGGADTVFLASLPLASFFPTANSLSRVGPGMLEAANDAMEEHAKAVETLAKEMSAEGADVRYVDMMSFSKAISEDPTSFGIYAPLNTYLRDGNSSFDDDQIAYWDTAHPAEAIQQAWGAYAAFVIEGGPTRVLSDGDDYIFEGQETSATLGLGGDDTIFGGYGEDVILGGSGNDVIDSGRENDVASGGSGDDYVRGKSGNDVLAGGIGDDTVRGEVGDDVLIDGLGRDDLRGGEGDDVLIFFDSTLFGGDVQERDNLFGEEGNDTLYLVLTQKDYNAFNNGQQDSIIEKMNLNIRDVETIVAINGRENVEAELGKFEWFSDADMWGMI